MSQVSPKTTASPLLPISYPSEHSRSNDATCGDGRDQGTSNSPQGSRPSRRVLDDLPDFTYEPTEESRDSLDSWPGQVEMKPRRRSTILSSLIRGNQPHRSFFGDKDDESEPATQASAAKKNEASKALHNARRFSKTAASVLKEKVPLSASPWKQKRSPTQSVNSRTRAHTFIFPFHSASCSSPAHPITVLHFHSSHEPPEEVHSIACKGFPHLRRAISPRRNSTLRRVGKAAHPRLVRVHPRHHHGLVQRRRDAHDGTPLCTLQRAHRALCPQRRPRRLPRRL